ncbi:MAG: hypothetical protein KGO82_14390, partial [Bacteroidota bacterium]|nr:hypothetical protein [Bacteroidota bacterium]
QIGQYFLQLGTSNNAAMLYVNNSNDTSKMFKGVRITGSTFNWFVNAPVINNVNNGGYNLVEDLEIDNNTIKNLTDTTTQAPGFYSGTGLRFYIHHNFIDSFQANATACRCVHTEPFYINGGFGECAYNVQKDSYGSLLRVYPAEYPGRAGCDTGTVEIHDNFLQYQLGYAGFEGNDLISAALTSLGFVNTSITVNVYQNTLQGSKVYVYNSAHPRTPPYSPWNPGLYDAFIGNSKVRNNLAIDIANDSNYAAYATRAFINTMSRAGSDTSGNRTYHYAIDAGYDSTNAPAILPTSPLRNSTFSVTPYSYKALNGVSRTGPGTDEPGAYKYIFISPDGPKRYRGRFKITN